MESTEKKLILRVPDVLTILGISKPCLYTWIKKGHFPKQFRYGPKLVGWDRKTVEDWIDSKRNALAAK